MHAIKQAQKLGKDVSENQNILDKIRLRTLKRKKKRFPKIQKSIRF